MMKNKKCICTVLISGFLTSIVMLVTLYLLKYAPFGGRALTYMDADIQYLDFYQYYKDVLCGENSLLYTFGKTLGGSNIAVFSYYLSSPFCLLLPFFSKTNLHNFFDIVVTLKLALASMTCCYFLLKRFSEQIQERLHYIFAIILSLGYALGQYTIAQCSNIMWLDGVYMLPLILLAVYRVVQNKGVWKLALLVGYTIIANWYSAGVDCVFSAFWLIFEIALTDEYFVGRKIKALFKVISYYVVGMITGVLLSAVIFLPTIGALKNSSRGSLELDRLMDFRFHGNVLNSLDHYAYGAVSDYGCAALFCSSIAVIAAVSAMISRNIKLRNKIVLSIMAAFAVVMCYWNPLFVLFSLFKDASSYWYRYSYLAIFLIIFIAAVYLFSIKNTSSAWIPMASAVVFAGCMLSVSYVHGNDDRNIYITAVILCIVGLVVSLAIKIYKMDHIVHKYNFLTGIVLLCITIAELQYNASLIMGIYYADDVDDFKVYQKQASDQIAALKDYDDGLYRISQTSTRRMGTSQITAFYNEGLAYNYWPISGYTSSPDDVQRNFLDRLGYRICGENLCVVNTSVLAADALLGVKYIFSKYPIKGLEKVDDLQMYNEKYVYKNPYCLPMAFLYNESDISMEASNPFEYQNAIWSQLYGETMELYTPVEYKVQQEGDVTSDTPLVYNLEIPHGNYAIYGNIPWYSEMDATVKINQEAEFKYSCWLSQSVFYIPTDENYEKITITVHSTLSYDIDNENVQFYALDLDKLKLVSEKLQMNIPSSFDIQNGYASVEIDNAETGQNVFLSVPYDKGWTVKRNGEQIETNLVGECMYSVPLVSGKNSIEMEYHVPYLKTGLMITITGVIILILMALYEKTVIFEREEKSK